MILAPFFPYYGSCHSMAKLYPRPRHDRLIEPFAGSACYSLHHPERDVVLVERDPVIAELWRWLIRISPAEVLALPDLEPGQSTDDLEVCPAARSLIGLWCNPASGGGPSKASSTWGKYGGIGGRGGHRMPRLNSWEARVRHRIARQLPAIRHWTVVEGEAMATTNHPCTPVSAGIARQSPSGGATWFIDPPYEGRPGSHYRYGSKLIDYGELGAWCQSLPGQAMVREQLGADWLPFERLGTVNGQRGKSTEVAWFSDERDRPGFRQPELFSR